MGNAAIGTVLHFSSTFVVLAITPLLVGRLGLEAYGLWALLNTAVRYGLLADVGLGPSLSKHIAHFYAVGDNRSIRATTTVGTLYFALIGAVALAGAILIGPAIFSHLPLSGALRPEAPGLFIWLMGTVALNFFLWGSPGATLTGRGQYRLTSAINALGSLVFAIVAIVLELRGLGLQGLVIAAYAQVVVTGAVGLVLLRVTAGPVFSNPFEIDRPLFFTILRFGGWLQLSAIAWLVIADTPALIVGFTIGVEYVAILDIATRLAKAVRALSYNFNNALMPAVSSLDAQATDRVLTFAPQAMRLMGLIALISSGVLVAAAPFLLRVWIGPQLPHEALLLILLGTVAPAYALESMTGVASAVARGVGRPMLDALYALTYAGTSLLATVLLVDIVGVEGVALASLIGVSVGSFAFYRTARTTPALRFGLLIGHWVLPALLAVVIAALAAWLVGRSFFGSVETRSTALFCAFVVGVCYATVLAIGLRLFRVITVSDLDGLRSVLPGRLAWVANARMTRLLFAGG